MKTSEYLNNKYTNTYYSIIAQAAARGPVLGYSEVHHIIPKSLGGDNSKTNLVRLTPKEHFLCHRLLTKMTVGPAKAKMIYAIRRLSYTGNRYQSERHVASSRTYAYVMKQAKEVHSERMKNNNPMHDPSIREVHSLAIAERGKTVGMTGKNHSVSTKELMREKRADQVITATAKKKISEKIKELTNSEGYVNAMHRPGVKEKHLFSVRESQEKTKQTCPHCGIATIIGPYRRWHSDNCRKKI
jgi:hypothetical protein